MAMTLRIRGRLVTFERPAVMGIVNVTPDSFFAGSRTQALDDIRRRVEQMMADGADMLDMGGYSSRPGAAEVSEQEELDRIGRGMEAIRSVAPEVPVSVDTFRASVAHAAVSEMGCDIVNDISGGLLDGDMAQTVAGLGCPYILMHMRGTPATMQQLTDYGGDVVAAVLGELAAAVHRFTQAGVADIIIDPGFGFAKTLEQNYRLMARLPEFRIFGLPLLVGISRKSMLTKLLGISADEALNATTALNAYALDRGADILRVHDVRAGRQAVDVYCQLQA